MTDGTGKAVPALLLIVLSLLICFGTGWLLFRVFRLYTTERRRRADLAGLKSGGKAFYVCTAAFLSFAFVLLCLTCWALDSNRIWAAVLGGAGAVLMLSGAVTVIAAADLKKMLIGFAAGSAGRLLCMLGLYACAETTGTDILLYTLLSVCSDAPALMTLWMLQDLFKGKMGSTDLNDARGFGRKKPLLHICLFSALYCLTAMPLSAQSVFRVISRETVRTITERLAEQGNAGQQVLAAGSDWLDLLIGAACAAGAIKLYICLFWSRNPGYQPGYDAMKRYAQDGQRLAFAVCLLAMALSGIVAVLLSGIHNTLTDLTGFKSAALRLLLGLSVYAAVIRTVCMAIRDNERVFVERLPQIVMRIPDRARQVKNG